jgi:putative heme-binding domain-containing protein
LAFVCAPVCRHWRTASPTCPPLRSSRGHDAAEQGTKLGPDLTGADRKNRDCLLNSIVDPSAVTRSEYDSFVIDTKDGRVLTGLIVESTPTAVTLANEEDERTIIPRDKIEELRPSPMSLTPEKLLDTSPRTALWSTPGVWTHVIRRTLHLSA